jgi:hypothetical protein
VNGRSSHYLTVIRSLYIDRAQLAFDMRSSD